MVITDILWMALLFLIPGMVSFTVYRHLAGYAIDKLYKFIFYSAIWSIFDYVIVEGMVGGIIYQVPFGKYLRVWAMFQYEFAGISIQEILKVLGVGIVVAYFLGRLVRYVRLHTPGLLYIKLWDYYVHTLWKSKSVVIIYDYKNGCRYKGIIKSFSYFTSRKEVVLEKAEVWSFGGKDEVRLTEKGQVPEVYVQLEDGYFSIVRLNSGVQAPSPSLFEPSFLKRWKRKRKNPIEHLLKNN